MFLDRKGILKCVLMILFYIAADVWIIAESVMTGEDLWYPILMLVLTVLCVLCVPELFGVSRYVRLYNLNVPNELKPAEFLKKYERIRFSDKLVVSKPHPAVLMRAANAYRLLDMEKQLFATLDEMVAVAKPNQKAVVLLYKADYLYAYGRTEEAEKFFAAAQNEKMPKNVKAFSDNIAKCDRAFAFGNYASAEQFCREELAKERPLLSIMSLHFMLAELCEKTGRETEALEHYNYCAMYGGETCYRTKSIEKLNAVRNTETAPVRDFGV